MNSRMFIPALWIMFFSFAIGLVLSLGAETLIKNIQHTGLSLALLIVVILIGIVSDAIGTAAAAADISPFNAMASKKVPGAREAVKIVKNADLVANLTADVGGDIAGTLSGAIGAAIIFSISKTFSLGNTVLISAVMTSLIAALTVGGKNIGKNIAITRANSIIIKVARILRWWENLTGRQLLK